ncbi:MAG: hypothetical protein IJT95_01865 [Abditibacteriota bacterium]|nr:hypothetical protein [Abditibacteriota bacterium]
MLRYSAIIFVVLAALLASGNIVMQKNSAETHNRAVETCMDFNEIKNLAATGGKTTEEVLTALKNAGVNSVALEMDTLATASAKGHVVLRAPGEYELRGYSSLTFIPKMFDIVFAGKVTASIFGSEILLRFDEKAVNRDLLEKVPIGFYDGEYNAAKNAGMIICGRVPSFDGASMKAINCILDYLTLLDVRRIVFNGDTILGYRSLAAPLGKELKKRQIYFGKVEFAKQKGEQKVAEENTEYLVIVHSITQAELATMAPETAIERYVKAVRERNVRILYLRPIDKSGNALKSCCGFVSALAAGLNKAGYQVKPIHRTEPMPANALLKAVCGAGAAAMLVILLSIAYNVRPSAQILLAAALTALFAYMCYKGGSLIKPVTLLLGIATPVCAVLAATRSPRDGSLRTGGPGTALLCVLLAFAVTMAGALFNLALLSDTSYIMRNQVYSGVKIAHFAPLFILSLLAVSGSLCSKESLKEQAARLRQVLSRPANWGYLILGAAALCITALMLARSGNDAGIGVSPLELRLRSLLDRIVYVRPRSKEFLIGYPSLLIGFTLLFKNIRGWGSVFTVGGSIALISLFNTFCHIHTPVIISLIRSANGLWCGIAAGLLCYLVLVRPFVKNQ